MKLNMHVTTWMRSHGYYFCPRSKCHFKSEKKSELIEHVRKTGHTQFKENVPKSMRKFLK